MSKKIRAKMKCQSIAKGLVELTAVTDGCEENKSFAKYTPYGEAKLQVDNPHALEGFKPGQEYYVDFTPAE